MISAEDQLLLEEMLACARAWYAERHPRSGYRSRYAPSVNWREYLKGKSAEQVITLIDAMVEVTRKKIADLSKRITEAGEEEKRRNLLEEKTAAEIDVKSLLGYVITNGQKPRVKAVAIERALDNGYVDPMFFESLDELFESGAPGSAAMSEAVRLQLGRLFKGLGDGTIVLGGKIG